MRLCKRARADGSAALVAEIGRPLSLDAAGTARAYARADEGRSEAEIARAFHVSEATISRLLGRRPCARWTSSNSSNHHLSAMAGRRTRRRLPRRPRPSWFDAAAEDGDPGLQIVVPPTEGRRRRRARVVERAPGRRLGDDRHVECARCKQLQLLLRRAGVPATTLRVPYRDAHRPASAPDVAPRSEVPTRASQQWRMVRGRVPALALGRQIGRRQRYWLRCASAIWPLNSGGMSATIASMFASASAAARQVPDRSGHAAFSSARERSHRWPCRFLAKSSHT